MLRLSVELRPLEVMYESYRELCEPLAELLPTLPRPGPHCWYCACLPVEAIVILLAPPGTARGADICAAAAVEGSKDGYWWKSLPVLFSWCGKGSRRTGTWSPLGRYSTGMGEREPEGMLS